LNLPVHGKSQFVPYERSGYRAPFMIDVALTASELRPAAVAVVIDVLRATSTATQALASGYRSVLCVDTIERALELRAPGRVLAGERRCVQPPGFDLGNSPADVGDGAGRELVLCTTNGVPAILAATEVAPCVVLACLLNLGAVAATLEQAGDVLLVCSGTDGQLALEDVYAAGRLAALLPGRRTDAALAAEAVARAFAVPFDALSASTDARRLRECGLAEDVAGCALVSELEVVPRVVSAAGGTALISSAASANSPLAAAADAVDPVGPVDAHATVVA
jgi:2-phosphosulfolactate phosphatase